MTVAWPVRVPCLNHQRLPTVSGRSTIQHRSTTMSSVTMGSTCGSAREHVAAGDVDVGRQLHDDGMTRAGLVDLLAPAVDGANGGRLPAGQHGDLVAAAQPAAGDHAGLAAEIAVLAALRADDPLHVHAHAGVAVRSGLELFEEVEQRRRRRTTGCCVEASTTLSPSSAEMGMAVTGTGWGSASTNDCTSAAMRWNVGLVPVDEVHLVHRQHDGLRAEHRGDERVAAGLVEHAVAGVDEHDGHVAGGRTGDHVARVLRVARACRRR